MSDETFRNIVLTLDALYLADKRLTINVCMDLVRTIRSHWDFPYSEPGELLSFVEGWQEKPTEENRGIVEEKKFEIYAAMDFEDQDNGNTTYWYVMSVASIVADLVNEDDTLDARTFSTFVEDICTVAYFYPDEREKHLDVLETVIKEFKCTPTEPTPEHIQEHFAHLQVAWDDVCENDTPQDTDELLEAYKRATRMKLDWTHPLARAIAERTTDEERVMALLAG